jgi:hypothetical protein
MQTIQGLEESKQFAQDLSVKVQEDDLFFC